LNAEVSHETSSDASVSFAERLIAWQQREGRHDLPWQQDVNSYRVWVSEIMLQQTQVSTVIPYFERFMQRFADLSSLAAAPLDEVLHLWSGLGYYSRARNLHASAVKACTQYGGTLPTDMDSLVALPGIGRSTAGAILSLACGQSQPILDGNAKRVLCRHAGITGWPGTSANTKLLWSLASARTPAHNAAAYTQAIMDVGATLCGRANPRCLLCPVRTDCKSQLDGTTAVIPAPRPKTERPVRQVRFMILRNTDEGAVWMVKRPPTGIWGGLWCFPELPMQTTPSQWCQTQGLLGTPVTTELAEIRHSFSHFELRITPTIIEFADARSNVLANGIMDSHEQQWCKPQALPDIGLAAPTKRLLTQLVAEHS
jgi:A/G-specific adenine glycosylase